MWIRSLKHLPINTILTLLPLHRQVPTAQRSKRSKSNPPTSPPAMALSQEEFRSQFSKRLEEMEARFPERLEKALAEQKTALMAEFGGKVSSSIGKDPQVGNSVPPVINIEDGVSKTAADIENQELKKRLETLERSMT